MIKFSIYFVISFVILSIPISEDRALFDLANQFAKPYTAQLFKSIKEKFSESTKEASEATKKVFNNTSPDELNEKFDKVKSKSSSVTKKVIQEIKADKHINFDHEDYTKEEREAILNIIKNN